MGANTFDCLPSPLPDRLNIVMTRNKGRKSHHCNVRFTDNPPEKILYELEQEGFPFAVLMGGTKVNTLFMERHLISEVHLTLVPHFFGTGLGLFNSPMDNALELKKIKEFTSGQILMVFQVILPTLLQGKANMASQSKATA